MKNFRSVVVGAVSCAVLVGGLQASAAQALPIASGVHVSAKAVKKCTLKKGATCKGKGVSKQKIGKKNLSGVKLSKGKIAGSKFTGTTLTKADFSGSMISDTTFSDTDLGKANFKGATLKNVTFDAGSNLNFVDFSGATLDHVMFKNTKSLSSFAPNGGRSVSVFCVNGMNNCPTPKFAGSHVAYAGFYSINFPGLDFSRSSIGLIDFYDSNFEYADFSYATAATLLIGQSNLKHSKFIGLSCKSTGDIYSSDFSYSNFTDAYGRCLDQIGPNGEDNVYLGAIGLDGFGKLNIDYSAGPKPSAVVVLESKSGMAYNRVCVDPTDCSVNLQVGLDATVKVWTATRSHLHLEGFECDDPIVDAANGNQFVSVCWRTIVPSDKGKTFTGIIDTRNHVTVKVGTPLDPTWPKTMDRIVIKVNGTIAKTCLNAKVCDVFAASSATVVVSVSSHVAYIYMAKRESQDSYPGEPLSSGGFIVTTPGLTFSEDAIFDASLS